MEKHTAGAGVSEKSHPLTCQQISTEVVVCGVTVRIVGDSSGAGEREIHLNGEGQKDNCVPGIPVNVLLHQLQCLTLHKHCIAKHAKPVYQPDLLCWVLKRHYARSVSLASQQPEIRYYLTYSTASSNDIIAGTQ